jgi:hypothetical protein
LPNRQAFFVSASLFLFIPSAPTAIFFAALLKILSIEYSAMTPAALRTKRFPDYSACSNGSENSDTASTHNGKRLRPLKKSAAVVVQKNARIGCTRLAERRTGIRRRLTQRAHAQATAIK